MLPRSFNSRTLGRVRPSRAGRCPGACPFQFTHPGKGATAPAPPWWAEGVEFQFTHPGKGATVLTDTRGLGDDVSIHAPWEGCDKLVGRTTLLRLSFNSRTLGRVRLSVALLLLILYTAFQFTHPGKGATFYPLSSCDVRYCFNSRTLGRVRQHHYQHLGDGVAFQFTHPGKGATEVHERSKLSV